MNQLKENPTSEEKLKREREVFEDKVFKEKIARLSSSYQDNIRKFNDDEKRLKELEKLEKWDEWFALRNGEWNDLNIKVNMEHETYDTFKQFHVPNNITLHR
jgi:hypothetical protein